MTMFRLSLPGMVRSLRGRGKRRKGTTLIELIIVSAILVGLSGIMLVALNAPERLRNTRETQEKSNAQQLERALQLRMVDKFGLLGSVQPIGVGEEKDICKQGVDPDVDNVDCVSLDELVSERYIASIPVRAGYERDTVKVTGFTIFRQNTYVQVRSKEGESEEGAQGGLFAQTPLNFAGPQGLFNYAAAVLEVNGTTYVGGSFSFIGKHEGSAISVQKTTKQRTSHLPLITGNVHAIESDGVGGWFVAGLSLVDAQGHARGNLLHVLQNGSISSWSPFPVDETEVIQALAFDMDTQRLYAAGYRFVGGFERGHLVAYDMSAGGVQLDWSPTINRGIETLLLHNGVLYAGGMFSSVDGVNVSRLAAFESAHETPSLLTWNPGIDAGIGAAVVFGLAARSDVLYVGGIFDVVAGQGRKGVAAFDVSDVNAITLSSWNAGANAAYQVRDIALHGEHLYASGQFEFAGGNIQHRLSAFDASTGALDTGWNPSLDGDVQSLLVDGNTLYVGGAFKNAEGSPRAHIASFDLSGGNRMLTSFNLGLNNQVQTMQALGNVLYLGGYFSAIGQYRTNLASFDAQGNLTDWHPEVRRNIGPANVVGLGVLGNRLYIGGNFQTVNGETRNRLAAFDLSTGELSSSWNPGTNDDNQSVGIAVDAGYVYVAGPFTTIDGQSIARLARIGTDGTVDTSWAPNPDQLVTAIAFDGDTVYVGGDFTTIAGQARQRIAALDRNTGQALPWNPGANDGVHALYKEGQTLYIGGNFTQIAEEERGRLAAWDLASDTLRGEWVPSVGFSVRSILPHGSAIYVGGKSASPGYLTAFDMNGQQLPWSPALSTSSLTEIGEMRVINGRLHVTGFFTIQRPDGKAVSGYAVFD